MEADKWTHIVVTHDGSGERAGLHLYRNGALVQEYGSAFFAKADGSMRVDRPLVLGRGMTRGRNGRDELRARHFTGGGIADLRVFNRPVTVEEARVIANWPALQRAREKVPMELDAEERDLLRLYYLSIKDPSYQQLLARNHELEREWREIRRRGAVTHVMQEVADQQPFAHVLNRGMYDDKRERVIAGTPSALRADGQIAATQPIGAGEVACRRRTPAHEPGDRQPLLAASLRRRVGAID